MPRLRIAIYAVATLAAGLFLGPGESFAMCSAAVKTGGPARPLGIHRYSYVVMGDSTGHSYMLSENGKPPRLVRMGRLNGEDYPIEFPPNAVFADGATDRDAAYMLRVTIQPPSEDGKSLPPEFLFTPPQKTSRAWAEIENRIQESDANYQSRGVVDQAALSTQQEAEAKLPLNRVAMISFFDPVTAANPVVLRAIDGSVSPGHFIGLFNNVFGDANTPPQILIEILYENLDGTAIALPERAFTNQFIFEIGRLGVVGHVVDGVLHLLNVFSATLARKLGMYTPLVRDSLRGSIYFAATKAGARNYLRLDGEGRPKFPGVQRLFTARMKKHPEKTVEILRFSLQDFFKYYPGASRESWPTLDP